MTRYALRVDSNQAQVISALEAAGATVDVIGKPVDLLVGYTSLKTGKNGFALFEIKSIKAKNPRTRTIEDYRTPAQQRFFQRWQGYPVCMVDGPEAALRHYRVLQS